MATPICRQVKVIELGEWVNGRVDGRVGKWAMGGQANRLAKRKRGR